MAICPKCAQIADIKNVCEHCGCEYQDSWLDAWIPFLIFGFFLISVMAMMTHFVLSG